MTTLILGILIVAAVSTAADFTWYTLGVSHTLTAGVIHGVVVLTAVGGALGAASGRTIKGLPIGAIAGAAGAASYYVLVATIDRRTYGSAIPLAWILMWCYLSALDGRWLRAPHRRAWTEIAARGVIAAVTAGLAFWLVMTTLWGPAPAGGRHYAVQFLAWTVAWTPGLMALTLGGRGRSRDGPRRPASRGHEAGSPSDPGSRGPRSIASHDLLRRVDAGERLHVLDVRSAREFAAGHVPGAVHVPFVRVASRLQDVPGTADDDLIVYCGHGPRAYIAAALLRWAGRSRIIYLTGHWAGWRAAKLRAER